MLAHSYTHTQTHPHTSGEGSELQTKSLTLWHFFGSAVQVSSAHRLLNKWIWNDLPRVSATWAQTQTLLLAYTPSTPYCTHTTLSTSLLLLLFIKRRWRRDTPTPRTTKERNLAEQHAIVSHHQQTQLLQTWAFHTHLFYTYLFLDIMENMSTNNRDSDLGLSRDFRNIISWNIHFYFLTTRDIMETQEQQHTGQRHSTSQWLLSPTSHLQSSYRRVHLFVFVIEMHHVWVNKCIVCVQFHS